MTSTGVLRRALLYDCVAYDLEDSVTSDKKVEARALVRSALNLPAPAGVRERAVRINTVESGLALADLTEVLRSPNLSTIVVPKVNRASDLTFVTDVIAHTLGGLSQQERPPISLLALIESAKAITNLSEICASTPLLQGLMFASEDFALDLSLTRTPSLTEFLFARSAIVTASRAHDLPSTIDLVHTAYKSSSVDRSSALTVLEEESQAGKWLGFNGKQCIHPSQVATVQSVFTPDSKEVEWAMRVVIADEKAAASGRGAWSLEGKMVDVPVANKAKMIIQRAEACGIDVARMREKWKGQEPE